MSLLHTYKQTHIHRPHPHSGSSLLLYIATEDFLAKLLKPTKIMSIKVVLVHIMMYSVCCSLNTMTCMDIYCVMILVFGCILICVFCGQHSALFIIIINSVLCHN